MPDSSITSLACSPTLKLAFVPGGDGSTETEGFIKDTVDVVERFVEEDVGHDRIKEADDIFFKWIGERDEKVKPTKADTNAEANEGEPQDVEMADEEERRTKELDTDRCRCG